MKKALFAVLLVCMLAACAPAVTSMPSTDDLSLTPTSSPVMGTPSPLPTQLTLPVTLDPAQIKQQEEIKGVIQAYFDLRYQALSITPPDDFQTDGFGNLVSNGSEAKDFLITEMAKLTVERKWRDLNRFGYVKYEYSLKYQDITIDASAQTVTVSLLEDFAIITEQDMEDDADDPNINKGDLTHKIVLHNEHGQWKIISDIYRDTWWLQFRKPGMSTDDILSKINEKLQRLEAIASATPAPTDPVFPVITPDPIQVERWKEYESALAQKLFPSSFIPDEFLCEWEILGKLEQELYVWTVCMSIFSVGNAGFPYHMEMPAVIHVKKNGEVQEVEIPRGGTHYAADIRRMFPVDAQERYFNNLIPFQELTDHLRWRREHPEEPPLIILGATLTATPIP